MKGVICYYSGSGNTKLACNYIAGKIGFPFHLVDVVRERVVDLTPYDVVGFATFTDFWGCPYLFQRFMESKPIFEISKCYGCWRCYNRCPKQAIYTERYRGRPYYMGPNDLLKEKLRI